MKINGKITEIITSRAFVSFGGFVELEGKEFEDRCKMQFNHN